MPFRLLKSNRPYVSKGHELAITAHKYSCKNDSLYYAYVQSPLCDWLVTFLPWKLAPNVITISGECCVVASCLMLGAYGWDLEGEGVPGWLCVTIGILYWLNTTLDNMDGK